MSSNVRVTRTTTFSVELDIDGHEIEIETGPAFAPIDADTVRWAPRGGGGWWVGWLALDDDRVDDFWDDRDSGVFREFTNELERDDFIADMQQQHGAERVFIVEKYEHSLVHYSPIGTQNYPDRRWDVAPCGVFVVPEDVPAEGREEYAKAVLDEFSSWCNGEIFGVVLRAVTPGPVFAEIDDEREECWGFIGGAYAQQTVEDAVKAGGI